MPSLEEIVEQGVKNGERAMLESKLLDYAWAADVEASRRGLPANHLTDYINRNYAELLGDVNGHGSNTGANPGPN